MIGIATILATIGMACVQLAPLRREVYTGAPASVSCVSPPADTDPTIAAALAARARREEARQLANRDPLLARDLRIGRPDLPRTYDDGGLVDLNSAPPATIADICDLDTNTAEAIVAARTQRGGLLATDDIFTMAEIPLGAWNMIRDRGLVIPR